MASRPQGQRGATAARGMARIVRERSAGASVEDQERLAAWAREDPARGPTSPSARPVPARITAAPATMTAKAMIPTMALVSHITLRVVVACAARGGTVQLLHAVALQVLASFVFVDSLQ